MKTAFVLATIVALVAGRSVDDNSGRPSRLEAEAAVEATAEARALVAVPPPVQTEGGFLPLRSGSPPSSTSSKAPGGAPQYPAFYYKSYYDNERTGVVAESSFEDDNISTSSEKAHPGAPTFSVPIPVPSGQANLHQAGHRQQSQAASDPVHHVEPFSSYTTYHGYQEPSSKKPIYQKMMEPFRKVGERFYEVAKPVLKPVMKAGQRLSERLQLPERMSTLSDTFHLDTMNDYISRTVDGEGLSLVAGVTAIAAIGLLGLAVAASSNATVIGKRSVDDPSLDFLHQLVERMPAEEPSLLRRLEEYISRAADTRCSRRIFCDVVSLAGDDLLYGIEKRLGLFLSALSRGSAEESSLKRTADEVVQAVRRRQCNVFACGGGQVDSSQVPKDSSGPR